MASFDNAELMRPFVRNTAQIKIVQNAGVCSQVTDIEAVLYMGG